MKLKDLIQHLRQWDLFSMATWTAVATHCPWHRNSLAGGRREGGTSDAAFISILRKSNIAYFQ